MEIKKTIKIGVEKKGKCVICKDTATVSLVLGTKGAVGNYHLYNITKEKGVFKVPLETIKERIKILEDRKADIEDSLEIMKQVVRKKRTKKD